MTDSSPNYDYVLMMSQKLAKTANPVVLDFGCGKGDSLVRAKEAGLDLWGADTYGTHFKDWKKEVNPEIADKIRIIKDGKLDFPDDHFDVVTANMVFEHVHDIPAAWSEILRVLKPGGVLFALFPTQGIWFEGHVGLYFAHWFRKWPSVQWRYLQSMHKLGYGYDFPDLNSSDWATQSQKVLQEACVYDSWKDIKRWSREIFGAEPRSIEVDYMRYRLSSSSRFNSMKTITDLRLMDPLLRSVCLVRAARVLVFDKKEDASAT